MSGNCNAILRGATCYILIIKKLLQVLFHTSYTYSLLLVITLTSNSSAQQPYLRHYTVDQGLASNEVYQVTQDGSGALLVATDRGLTKFDGYAFETVPIKGSTFKPIYYLYPSPSGKIYMSSMGGKIYQYDDETINEFHEKLPAQNIFAHPGLLIANSIASYRDSLFISYNNDYSYNFQVGSCVIDPAGNTHIINDPDGIYFNLKRRFYYRQLSQSSFSTKTQPVYIKWPDGRTTKDSVLLNWQGGYIRRLFYHKYKALDIICIGRKIIVYQQKQKIAEREFPSDILYMTGINDRLYLGLENKGVLVYDLTDSLLQKSVQSYLEGLSVNCIYQDNQKGLWFATQENGLFYQHPSNVIIWNENAKFSSLTKIKDTVYAGTFQGRIISFINGQKVNTQQLTIPPTNHLIRFSSDYARSLIAITDGGYWIKKNTWQFIRGNDIQLLSVNNKLSFGAATDNAKLNIYNGIAGKLLNQFNLAKRIITMYYDSHQQLWLGTWEGLYRYDGYAINDLTGRNNVFKDRIVGIDQLGNGSLVFASLTNGLCIQTNDQYYILNSTNGWNTPIINSLGVDGNNIWLGTNRGLVLVQFVNGKFTARNFGLESGLPTIDIHYLVANHGWIYLRSVNEIITIPLASLERYFATGPTKIIDVRVNNTTVKSGSTPTFTSNQNNLSFTFISNNLSSAADLSYGYYLEGFDKEEHFTNARTVKYTNLSPGHYTFIVRAVSTSHHSPPAKADGFSFDIRFPWWQRWWFVTLALLLFFTLVYIVYLLRIRAIERKNKVLVDLAESRQKAMVQLINPHFFFNMLNSVQGSIMKQDPINAASLISRLARLFRMSLELSKRKLVPLQHEVKLLENYLALETLRMEGKFDYSITMDPAIQSQEFEIPPMLIQPFIENAINHGIMHKGSGKGMIAITFTCRQTALICSVDDNGIGRKQSAIINSSLNPKHESSGIEITVNRLALLHQQMHSTYFYEVRDKVSEDGTPQGTTIIFSLPYKK